MYINSTIDVMPLKETIELGAYALSLLVLYCEDRGAFVPLDIFNEKRHPIVEVGGKTLRRSNIEGGKIA